MTQAITLFFLFFKLGFFSFGGGYSMIPLIEQALEVQGIQLSPEIIANISAIAGIAPGPVGANLAFGFGYEIGGIFGVIAAGLGVALPSMITVGIVSLIFDKIYHSSLFKSALDGLRPVVVGIITYAGLSIAIKNGMFFAPISKTIINSLNVTVFNSVFNIPSIILSITAFIILLKTKIHPIFLIVGGAILGIIIF